MNTLIKLYCERPVENVIPLETFHPERVVFLCPVEVEADADTKRNLKAFLKKRGITAEIIFKACSPYLPEKIIRLLKNTVKKYPDSVLDVTGGSDASLFAAGMFCRESGIPAFTYSRRKNMFFNIQHAAFANELPCQLVYSVDDFFHMAGGSTRQGRVEQEKIINNLPFINDFFFIFLRFRRIWPDQVTFFQRISRQDGEENLAVSGSLEQKGDHGTRIRGDMSLLAELCRIGFISGLSLEGDTVSFRFRDQQTRYWLRDVGSVLELFMYKECVQSGIFHDVTCSAVVDWNGLQGKATVTNEIDVVASRNVTPVFISCKTGEIKTEALNELAVLRDRFGGKGAKAIIITTELCNAAARHRAAQLQIAVIDREELQDGNVKDRLAVIMKLDTVKEGA